MRDPTSQNLGLEAEGPNSACFMGPSIRLYVQLPWQTGHVPHAKEFYLNSQAKESIQLF